MTSDSFCCRISLPVSFCRISLPVSDGGLAIVQDCIPQHLAESVQVKRFRDDRHGAQVEQPLFGIRAEVAAHETTANVRIEIQIGRASCRERVWESDVGGLI